jgi:DNA polymerase-1
MRFILIDGYGFVYRSFYGTAKLTRSSDGHPVGAVYGFTKMLKEVLKDRDSWCPTHAAVIFDASRRNWRHDVYPDYKANRGETDYDLKCQFPLVRQATGAFGVSKVELDGYEADDIIATYARQVSEAGGWVKIVTSDKDMTQLMTDRVEVFDPMKNAMVTNDDVMEKFGVSPRLVTHVQALCGDKVDNVPGVPNVGPKKAAGLIQQFGSLEAVLQNPDMIEQSRLAELVELYTEQARLSYELVRLKDDVPGLPGFDQLCLPDHDEGRLQEFLDEMEFVSIEAAL